MQRENGRRTAHPLLAQGSAENVPIAIGVPVWERHLAAAIPIEAGRLSHNFMPLRPNGTYF
jgi:hypothetical protein